MTGEEATWVIEVARLGSWWELEQWSKARAYKIDLPGALDGAAHVLDPTNRLRLAVSLSNGTMISAYAPVCYWETWHEDEASMPAWTREKREFNAEFDRQLDAIEATLGEATWRRQESDSESFGPLRVHIWQTGGSLFVLQQALFDPQFGLEINCWIVYGRPTIEGASVPFVDWLSGLVPQNVQTDASVALLAHVVGEMSDFASVYDAYFRRVISPSVPGWEAGDQEENAWIGSQRLEQSADGARWLDSLSELAPRGTRWDLIPDLYRSHAWDALELPMLILLGPGSTLARAIAPGFVGNALFPFALDLGDGGFYALDLAATSEGAVYWTPNGSVTRDSLRGPLATSATSLLAVITELLSPSGSRESPAQENEFRALVRAVDPVAGGAAWDDWWSSQVFSSRVS